MKQKLNEKEIDNIVGGLEGVDRAFLQAVALGKIQPMIIGTTVSYNYEGAKKELILTAMQAKSLSIYMDLLYQEQTVIMEAVDAK